MIKKERNISLIVIILVLLFTPLLQLNTKAQLSTSAIDNFNGIWKTSISSSKILEDVTVVLCGENDSLKGTLSILGRDFNKLTINEIMTLTPFKISGTITDLNNKILPVKLSILKTGEMKTSVRGSKTSTLKKISSNSCTVIASSSSTSSSTSGSTGSTTTSTSSSSTSSSSSSSTSSGTTCTAEEVKCSNGMCVKNSAACIINSSCNLPTPFTCPNGECQDFTAFCKNFDYQNICLCSNSANGGPWCKAKPVNCSSAYAPVCACDGLTHFNACTAAFANNRTFVLGACKSVTKTIKCTGSTPVECFSTGNCVARIRDCGEGLSAVGCPSEKPKSCDDGRCVLDYSECSPSLFEQINLTPPN